MRNGKTLKTYRKNIYRAVGFNWRYKEGGALKIKAAKCNEDDKQQTP